jgi:hypothetical protein
MLHYNNNIILIIQGIALFNLSYFKTFKIKFIVGIDKIIKLIIIKIRFNKELIIYKIKDIQFRNKIQLILIK